MEAFENNSATDGSLEINASPEHLARTVAENEAVTRVVIKYLSVLLAREYAACNLRTSRVRASLALSFARINYRI